MAYTMIGFSTIWEVTDENFSKANCDLLNSKSWIQVLWNLNLIQYLIWLSWFEHVRILIPIIIWNTLVVNEIFLTDWREIFDMFRQISRTGNFQFQLQLISIFVENYSIYQLNQKFVHKLHDKRKCAEFKISTHIVQNIQYMMHCQYF